MAGTGVGVLLSQIEKDYIVLIRHLHLWRAMKESIRNGTLLVMYTSHVHLAVSIRWTGLLASPSTAQCCTQRWHLTVRYSSKLVDLL